MSWRSAGMRDKGTSNLGRSILTASILNRSILNRSILSGSILMLGAFSVECRAATGEFELGSLEPVPQASQVSVRIGNSPYYDTGIGIGLTADPNTFLVAADLRLPFREEFYFGPAVDLGISNDEFFLAPAARFGKSVILDSWEGPSDLEISADVGAGVAYYRVDRRRGNDDEVGPVFQVGVGASLPIGDEIRLGTSLRFHFLPTELVNETVIFSWQVLQFRF